MTQADLQSIMAAHKQWLTDPDTGSRANLDGADLRAANLRGTDLRAANLRGTDLRGADLRGANLGGVNLGGAYLRGANLSSADLGDANLSNANLGGAYLGSADLSNANLDGAYLGGAQGYVCMGWDSRGYHFRAVLFPHGWQITAGCRNFTLAEAVAHWTAAGNRDALARLAILAAHEIPQEATP